MRVAFHEIAFFQPLLQPRFRRLWCANLLANIGAWAQAFAVAWHLSVLSQSALVTSLVQTATWAPMLLLSLPAGLLGDVVHKRGGLLWGKLANGLGLTPVLLCAAGAMLACALAMSCSDNFLDTE